MSGAFQFDVLLSHNSADKPRVRRLAERLRAAEREVDLRSSDFGLRTSAGRGRLGLERSTVLFRHPANAGRRFIPLVVADGACPNGARSSSPRLAPRAYLGSTIRGRNPNGVVASERKGRNPAGVVGSLRDHVPG